MNGRNKLAWLGAALCAAVLVSGYGPDALAAGKCPDKSSVTKIASDNPDFKAAQPVAFTTLKSSKAIVKQEGKELKVFLSNGAFTGKQMDNDMVLPIKTKGDAVVVLRFMNGPDKVVPGDYTPTVGWGKPHFITVDVMVIGTKPAGTVITFAAGGSSEKGTATITEMTDKTVCGTFDVTGALGSVSGAFAAEIEK